MTNNDSKRSDDAIAHPFDQTNGLADGLEGDSDGTAASDTHSATERDDQNIADPAEGSAALFRGNSS